MFSATGGAARVVLSRACATLRHAVPRGTTSLPESPMHRVRHVVVAVVVVAASAAAGSGCSGYRSVKIHEMGQRLHRGGNVAEAIEYYDTAIAENPSNARAYNDRGLARRETG